MTKEQADTIIKLLQQGLEAQQTGAVLLAQIAADLAAPRLAAEHVRVQQRQWLSEAENQREAARVRDEIERGKRAQEMPSLWAGGPPPPLPEGEDDDEGDSDAHVT